MIAALKSKLSKAEYERGVFKHQLGEAEKRIAELEKQNRGLKIQVGKLKAKGKGKATKATAEK
ncbi:hypothetical protein [Maridesulfovibrio sp.]|uniref:hypothetical protein n=1 Tax=Maridesulfovibrio sp. TaxID=2795000 RepID=UPI003BABEEB4